MSTTSSTIVVLMLLIVLLSSISIKLVWFLTELDNSQNDDPNQNKVLIYFYIPKSKRKKNMIILWN